MASKNESIACEGGEDDAAFFSDESDFHGNAFVKAKFAETAHEFHSTKYWEKHEGSLQRKAAKERRRIRKIAATEAANGKEEKPQIVEKGANLDREIIPIISDHDSAEIVDLDPNPSIEMYNPYEGDTMAKQLSEPLDAFLARLKPSVTTVSSGPWIWIANPSSSYRHNDPDVAGFKDSGFTLLSDFMSVKRQLEESNPTKAPGTITRLLRSDREDLESSIISLAQSKKLTTGKWMLFPLPHTVDKIWAKVAAATLDGRLGCAAKVATGEHDTTSTTFTSPSSSITTTTTNGDHNNNNNQATPYKAKERVICIYTTDFAAKDDVKRVLNHMRRLGLVGNNEDDRAIYYKCDAYTYLDIVNGNEFKLKASMYCSRDLFKEMANEKQKKKI